MIRGLQKYKTPMARALWGSVTPLLSTFGDRSGAYIQHLRTPKTHFSTAAMLDGGQRRYDPSLEVLGGAMELYLPVFKTLDRPYDAFGPVGWNCHVETIFASFFRSVPVVRLRRECLRTKDDGAVALDWVSGDDRRLGVDSPVLILLVSSFAILPFRQCGSCRIMYECLCSVWLRENSRENKIAFGILLLPSQFEHSAVCLLFFIFLIMY